MRLMHHTEIDVRFLQSLVSICVLQHPVSGDKTPTAQLPPLLLNCDNHAKQVFSLVLQQAVGHGFLTLKSTASRVHMTGVVGGFRRRRPRCMMGWSTS